MRAALHLLFGAVAIAAASPARSQTEAAPPIASAPGDPAVADPTTTQQGIAAPAAEDNTKQPPVVALSVLYTAERWGNARGGRGTGRAISTIWTRS